jgi:hypothetical protein
VDLENLFRRNSAVAPPGVETNPEIGRPWRYATRCGSGSARLGFSCAACLMEIGFARAVDFIGKLRETDEASVNAAGKLVDGTPLDGPGSPRRCHSARGVRTTGRAEAALRRAAEISICLSCRIARDRRNGNRFSALSPGS